MKVFLRRLESLYPPREIKNIVRALMEDLIRASLYNSQPLNPDQVGQLEDALDRLLNGEPVQYITGLAHFYGYRFKVGPEVMIPRPETEELVYRCISRLAAMDGQIPGQCRILDIGTGSGCIAIILKKKIPDGEVWALDLDDRAIAVAKENAKALGVDITFVQLNIFDDKSTEKLPVFDVLISNPPYIPDSDKSFMDKTVVGYEPQSALFVPDDDPLKFYKRILVFSRIHLSPGGLLCLELNDKYAEQVEKLVAQKSFRDIELSRDLQGRERHLSAIR